jgi:hypothetical protein
MKKYRNFGLHNRNEACLSRVICTVHNSRFIGTNHKRSKFLAPQQIRRLFEPCDLYNTIAQIRWNESRKVEIPVATTEMKLVWAVWSLQDNNPHSSERIKQVEISDATRVMIFVWDVWYAQYNSPDSLERIKKIRNSGRHNRNEACLSCVFFKVKKAGFVGLDHKRSKFLTPKQKWSLFDLCDHYRTTILIRRNESWNFEFSGPIREMKLV